MQNVEECEVYIFVQDAAGIGPAAAEMRAPEVGRPPRVMSLDWLRRPNSLIEFIIYSAVKAEGNGLRTLCPSINLIRFTIHTMNMQTYHQEVSR